MRKAVKTLSAVLVFLLSINFSSFSQPCGADAPQTYEAIPDGSNPGQCFLTMDWGTEMPQLECGTPGTPAPGSTVPSNRKLSSLSVTINAVPITLYNKSGGNCTGATADLAYHTDINSYITIYSSTDFCNAGFATTTHVDGNQTGATAINCDMSNSNVLVPITLEQFLVEIKQDKIVLRWKTSSEENTDYFTLERSWDGNRFHTIGKLAAAGYSNTPKNYQWEDQSDNPVIYYRLKITDFDEEVNYSPTAVVTQRTKETNQINLYPSPLRETLNISVNLPQSEPLNISVFNLAGQLLFSENWDAFAGSNDKEIDLSEIPNQLLVVQINGTTSHKIQKIWKQ